MAERLTANIILSGPDGMPAAFLEGTPKSEVPDWAQERITNPDVWGSDQESEEEPAKATPRRNTAKK